MEILKGLGVTVKSVRVLVIFNWPLIYQVTRGLPERFLTKATKYQELRTDKGDPEVPKDWCGLILLPDLPQ